MPSTKDRDNPIPDLIVQRIAANKEKQADAARAMGIKQSSLKAIIEREKGIGRVMAPRVAAYLGIPVAEFFQMAGLAPLTDEDDLDFYELQIRELFKRATDDQKKKIVGMAELLVGNAKDNVSTKRKPKPA